MPTKPPPTLQRRTGAWDVRLAIVVLLLAGGVRAAAIRLEPGSFSVDVDGYQALAENLVEHGVYGHGQRPTAFRPPVYPLLLAALAQCGLLTWQGIATLHVLLGVGTVAFVLIAGRQLGLGRYRFLAAALVACDPILLNQSRLVMTESLAAFLAAAGLVALCGVVRRPTIERGLWAGVVLGLAVLCRPTFLAWAATAPFCLLWLLPANAARLRAIVLVLLGTTLTLTPWAVRNQRVLGEPIVTTTHGGYTLFLANNPLFYAHLQETPSELWDANGFNTHLIETPQLHPRRNEVRADLEEYRRGWREIQDQPAMFARAAVYRLSRFWGLLPLAIDAPDAARGTRLRYASAVWYALEFALALVGLIGLSRRSLTTPWVFGLLLAATFTAAHLLFWTDLRMRAPVEPAVALWAAAGAAWIGSFFRVATRDAATS